jgi:HTH-type transcriptional regulator / antitoxin HigA
MSAKPGTPEGDELDVLATLVDAWEATNHPIDAPDPVAAIEFRMEQQGLSRSDLEPMIGSRARVSEVLNGKRKLTIEMIRRVRLGLGISADSLIESGTPARNRQGKRRKSALSRVSASRPSDRSTVRGSSTR